MDDAAAPVSGANSIKHRRPYKMTKLTIVGGREAKTKSKTKRRKRPFTGRQLAFIEGVVNGLSQTESYKQAYSTSKMSIGTIYSRAYDCRHHGQISDEINRRVEAREADKRLSRGSRYDLVISRLVEESDPTMRDDTSAAARVAALRALGSVAMSDTAGADTGQSMFVERQSVTSEERSSEEVMAELQRRLATLDQ